LQSCLNSENNRNKNVYSNETVLKEETDMARPCKKRCINGKVKKYALKPEGLNKRCYLKIDLRPDEVEAIRLADFQGKYQAEAATLMHISRQTFARVVKSARKKLSDAVLNGKIINISCCKPEKLRKKP